MVCMGERVCRRSCDQMDKLKEAQEAAHIPADCRYGKECGGRHSVWEDGFFLVAVKSRIMAPVDPGREGWNGICEEEACGDQAV